MSDGITVTLSGIKEISEKIREVETNIARSAARAGIKAGAQIIEDQVRTNADRIDDPETPNRIADNITSITRWDGRQGTMTGSVGVVGGAVYKRGQKKLDRTSTTYFRFVEFGTRYAPAQPFLRPAVKGNEAKILAAVTAKMNQVLSKKISMLPKK